MTERQRGQASSLWDRPTRSRAPSRVLLSRSTPSLSELSQESSLGEYQIEEKLHEGRWAAIYAARHQFLGRRVAIKILDDDQKYNPVAIDCLVREGKTAGILGLGACPKIETLALTRTGRPYTVMDRLEGHSMDAVLERGPVHRAQVVRFLVSLCDVLAGVHEHGIAHRDLAPRHIFIHRDRGVVRVKLLDFGLSVGAKAKGNQPEFANPNLFTHGSRAPELGRSECKDARRCDMYSVGVLAFRLLVGRHPYFYRQSSAPGKRAISENGLWRQLPPLLEVFLRRSLSEDPDLRPRAGEARAMLRDCLPLVDGSARDRSQVTQRPQRSAAHASSPAAVHSASNVRASLLLVPSGLLVQRQAVANANEDEDLELEGIFDNLPQAERRLAVGSESDVHDAHAAEDFDTLRDDPPSVQSETNAVGRHCDTASSESALARASDDREAVLEDDSSAIDIDLWEFEVAADECVETEHSASLSPPSLSLDEVVTLRARVRPQLWLLLAFALAGAVAVYSLH